MVLLKVLRAALAPLVRDFRFGDLGWEDLHQGLPGLAQRIAVDADGNTWVVMEDGAIFSWK